MVFLAGMRPGNAIPGYQSRGGASLGRQIQFGDSGRQHLGFQMAVDQQPSLTATWGRHQPTALLKGFLTTYTCLGLSPLSEGLSPFLDMLPDSSLKSLTLDFAVPETPLSP